MSQAAAPIVSVIVRWAPGVATALAEEVEERLSLSGVNATWSVAEPAQARRMIEKSTSASALDFVLSTEEIHGDVNAARQTLARFAASGHGVSGIEVTRSLPRGVFERQLCQAGVRAIVCRPRHGNSSMTRPLPFGIWEFAPHISIPARRGWLRTSTAHRLLRKLQGQFSFATLDLQRIAANQSSCFREIDQFTAAVAELSAAGRIQLSTIGALAADYWRQAAGRPQRSILRVAA